MGTFWGFLNVSLRASAAQLGLDIVDQMWVQFRMGSWGFTLFWAYLAIFGVVGRANYGQVGLS